MKDNNPPFYGGNWGDEGSVGIMAAFFVYEMKRVR